MITEENIFVYRQIYYETVKPMLKGGRTQEEINQAVIFMSKEYDIDPNLYHALAAIDLIQRVAKIKGSDRMKLRIDDKELVVESFNSLPQLRCPIRSEQQEE